MLKKKNIIITVVAVILLAIMGRPFFTNDIKVNGGMAELKEKPVKTLKLNEKTESTYLEYIGTVNSNEIKKLGFKSPGKISKVNVKKGQKVTKGMTLVTLDVDDLKYSVDGARAQLEGATAQYDKAVSGAKQEEVNRAAIDIDKAESAYNYSLENHDRYKNLYEEDVIPKQNLEQAKLELDAREADLRKAKEAYTEIKAGAREEDKRVLNAQIDQARASYDHKNSMLQDSVIVSDIDGYVVDILYEEGEIAPAGHPVVIIRGKDQIVNIGVTQADISKLELGNKAKVYADEIETEGTIGNISEMPDMKTRTYNVEVVLAGDVFKLGAVTNVDIDLGAQKGIWVPVKSIKSGNYDYVFVSDKGIAKKKTVKIITSKDFDAKVEGLASGDELIIEGMDRLVEGDKTVNKK